MTQALTLTNLQETETSGLNDLLQAAKKKRTRDIADNYGVTHDVEETFLSQRLDHFDHTNKATFQQRYFSTKRYVLENAPTEVTFLCVGGEGPGFDKSVLVDSVHCTGDMLNWRRFCPETMA